MGVKTETAGELICSPAVSLVAAPRFFLHVHATGPEDVSIVGSDSYCLNALLLLGSLCFLLIGARVPG